MAKFIGSLWLLIVFTSLATLADAASQGDKSFLSPYESIRALDEFGNAKQLDFASKAAQEQSSLVILLQDPRTDQTWIVSLPQRPRAPHLRTITPLVHPISMPIWGSKSPPTDRSAFVVCTGLQGDARWLMKQLRQYTSRLWAMSDLSTPTGPALAHGVASLMRLFWGYPTDVSISSSVLRGVVEREELARPLGLQVSLLVFDRDSRASNSTTLPHVYDINPTGNIVDATSLANEGASEKKRLQLVSCMGSQHHVVREKLEEALSKDMFNEDVLSNHTSLGRWLCRVLEETLGPLQGRTLVVQQLAANGTLTPEFSLDV
jgi:20S proteasome alpha/beta subunit